LLPKIIYFDLDGTLIDSTKAIVDTFYYTFDKFNFDFVKNHNKIASTIGYPLEIMYEKLGVQKNDISKFVDAYRERYIKISLAQTTLLENSIEAVELASKNARLGVVTTKMAKYTAPLLEHMKIMKYFEFIIGREDVINPKPDPEPILKAINKMDISVGDNLIYMIGDTKLDMISAKKAGIKGVGVLCGHGTLDELKQHTDCITDDALGAVNAIINL
jgi:phosphoglycolate phosphatase